MSLSLPSLPNIVDLVRLQNTVALILLADDRLATIPILTEIKLHMDNEVAVDALWTLPRAAIQVKPDRIDLFSAIVDTQGTIAASGPIGAGLLVEMIEAFCPSNAVSGPPLRWKVNVVAFEERNTNLTANVGQLIMAEQLAQLVLDVLQLQAVFGFGTLQASSNAITPAQDWQTRFDGIVAYRSTLEASIGRVQTQRSAFPTIAIAGGMATITCQDPAAEIRYTIDGSAPVKSNPSALVYNAPVPVASGMSIQASTWKQGFILSSINGAVAP